MNPQRAFSVTSWPLASGLLLGLAGRGAGVRPPPPTLEANSAPAAPTGLTAAHNGETVTATWVPPTGATKYHITYSTDGMNSWSGPSCGDNCTASGTETEASFTITGTDPGKTYVVGLRAGNQRRLEQLGQLRPGAGAQPAAGYAVSGERNPCRWHACRLRVLGQQRHQVPYHLHFQRRPELDGRRLWRQLHRNQHHHHRR